MAKVIKDRAIHFLNERKREDGVTIELSVAIPLDPRYKESLILLDALLEKCHYEILEEMEELERTGGMRDDPDEPPLAAHEPVAAA